MNKTTMQAAQQQSYGLDTDVVLCPIPTVGEHEVLVQVAAAGVDRGTWHLMTGLPYVMRLGTGLSKPRRRIPGRDLAGTVVQIGSKVTDFAVGDEVLGIASGAFAEYAVARESKLVAKPATLDMDQAAVLATSGLTAWQALHTHGKVKTGQRVLVLGASGGVGTFAVQIARAAGAEVTGVCSSEKAELVASLGAKHVLDYRTDPIDGTFDLIIDIGGRSSLRRLRSLTRPGGTVVLVGGEGGGSFTGGVGRQIRAAMLSPFVSQRLVMMIASENKDDLTALVDLVRSGDVAAAVGRTFPLEAASDAVRHLVEGQAMGKVVVRVSETTDTQEHRTQAAQA
ncbi:MAG: NAD(P)-dependent alcohol dehydrogenase [Candidatus Nanopelagicales bacterium]